MTGDAAPRLADQEAADMVVIALHVDHLLEHGAARRRQNATDDDVADLALGVASNERYQAVASHLSRTFAVSVMAMATARTMRSSSIEASSEDCAAAR